MQPRKRRFREHAVLCSSVVQFSTTHKTVWYNPKEVRIVQICTVIWAKLYRHLYNPYEHAIQQAVRSQQVVPLSSRCYQSNEKKLLKE